MQTENVRRPVVEVQISPEMNRWNLYASRLVRLAVKLHGTIDFGSLTKQEIAESGIVF